jgi:hypothetical protein
LWQLQPQVARKTIIVEKPKALIAAVLIKKVWWAIKPKQMKHPNREIVLLLKTGKMSDEALGKELDKLEIVLFQTESTSVFCKTHELVDRNRITRKEAKLINCYYQKELKPFRFLVCKN